VPHRKHFCVTKTTYPVANLTFVGPCIVIYFYSTTNQTHNITNLFYFGTTLYILRTVSPSIIRSLRLYIQYQVYAIQVLAGKQPQTLYDIYLMLYYSLRFLMMDGETSEICKVFRVCKSEHHHTFN